MATAGVLVESGRAATAAAVAASAAIHLAWGEGDPSWGITPPPEPMAATALEAEVGRREMTEVGFVVPDPQGAVIVPNGTFTVSLVPTPFLYLRCFFSFDDAVGDTIREVGVFLNTTREAEVDPAKAYLVPAEIDSPGTLLILQRSAPVLREITTRQQFEYVLAY